MAVDYFQPETFQQANPILSGIGAAQQIFGQGIQNAYLPQTLAQQLALMKAQTGLTQAQGQYFPLTAQGQYLRGMGDYLRGYGMNSPARMIGLFQNNPGFQAMVANNPMLADQISTIEKNASLYGGTGGLGMPGIPGMPNTQLPQQNTQVAPSNLNPNQPMGNSINVPLGNLPSVSAGGNIPLTPQQQKLFNQLQQTNGGTTLPQSDSQAFGDALGSEAIKKTQTNQVMNQRQYAQILDPLLAQGEQLMPSVSKYSGLLGKAELAKDAAKSALGFNSPDYTNYSLFTNTLAPNVANELRRVLGGQATDAEFKLMDEIADPNYWHSNPQLALTQYKYLVSLYKNIVNSAISKSPAQVQQNLQQQPINANPNNLINTATNNSAARIRVISPDGKTGTISANNLANAMQQGYRRAQ